MATATPWHSQVCGWVPLAEHVSAVHPADQAQEAGHVVLVAVHAEHAHALTGKVWGRQAAGWEQDGRKGGGATQRGEGRQLLMPMSVVAAWLVGLRSADGGLPVATTVQTAADLKDGLLSPVNPTAPPRPPALQALLPTVRSLQNPGSQRAHRRHSSCNGSSHSSRVSIRPSTCLSAHAPELSGSICFTAHCCSNT